MTTSESQLLALAALQRANMQSMVAFDKLASSNQLPQASIAGAALCAALDRQSAMCEVVNRSNVKPEHAQMPPDSVWLDVMLRRADMAESLSQAEEGKALRKTAMARAAQLGGTAYAERQRQIAGSLMEKGSFHEALTTLDAARLMSERFGDAQLLAACQADIADAFEWLGDDGRALRAAAAALAAAGITSGHQVAAADEQLARALALGGQADNAMGAIDPDPLAQGLAKMLALKDKVNRDAVCSKVWQLQARCLGRKGEYAAARALLEKARPTVPSYAQPALDFQLAKMQVQAGEYEAAIQAIDAMLPLFGSGPLRRKLAALLELKARALLESENDGDALMVMNQAHDAMAGFDDPDMFWKVWAREAQAFAAIGEPVGLFSSALASNDNAVKIIDWLRRAPLGTRLDSLHLKEKLPVFERGIDWAVREGDAKACCRYIEMVKARQLAVLMSVPGGHGAANNLSREVDAITEKLAAIGYGAGDAQQLGLLAEQRRNLVEQQRIQDPRWRQLTEAPSIDVDRYLHELGKRKQAAITMYLNRDHCTAVLLYNGEVKVAVLEIEPSLHALLSARSKSTAPSSVSWDLDPLFDLASWLPIEFVTTAMQAESLVMVPHVGLHMLPWALMRYDDKPLFEYLPVTQLPNLSMITSIIAEALPALTAVGASPSIAARLDADQECANIAALYQAKGHAVDENLGGTQSTRQAFLALIHGPKRVGGVLHVACHGVVDLSDPMSSHLSLEQGCVDAVAIASGALAFDEVILSACSAGHRPQDDKGVALVGDEIMGLAGAFLEAGARQLVVSLSPTRDLAAAEFMLEYHRGRTEGQPPRHAFRRAQRAMWNSVIHQPQDWGGFVLLGR
jgi:CHAT domain-containing protein